MSNSKKIRTQGKMHASKGVNTDTARNSCERISAARDSVSLSQKALARSLESNFALIQANVLSRLEKEKGKD